MGGHNRRRARQGPGRTVRVHLSQQPRVACPVTVSRSREGPRPGAIGRGWTLCKGRPQNLPPNLMSPSPASPHNRSRGRGPPSLVTVHTDQGNATRGPGTHAHPCTHPHTCTPVPLPPVTPAPKSVLNPVWRGLFHPHSSHAVAWKYGLSTTVAAQATALARRGEALRV